jgi:hypothetical protein
MRYFNEAVISDQSPGLNHAQIFSIDLIWGQFGLKVIAKHNNLGQMWRLAATT